MPRHPSLRISDYLEIAQVFHWASRDHFVSFFTGKVQRHKRTETLLPRLVRRNKLRVAKLGKKHVYSAPRKARKMIDFDDPLIEHGVACTEGLVRFYRADMNCTLISEKFFRALRLRVCPEWGIVYPNGKLLLFEFSTTSNFNHGGVLKSKITRYEKTILEFETAFKAEAIVLFVLDVSKETFRLFLNRYVPMDGKFFFTDYATFTCVPLGSQLKAPIYVWGRDGKVYPLRDA